MASRFSAILCAASTLLLTAPFPAIGAPNPAPASGGDDSLTLGTTAAHGAPGAWELPGDGQTLVFKSAAGAASEPVPYLKITYADCGYGHLFIKYKNAAGELARPDRSMWTWLCNTGVSVTSYARCPGIDPTAAEVHVKFEPADQAEKGAALAVSEISLHGAPFSDPHFQYLVADDWSHPYTGPTAPGIDNKTIQGKVMVGYQGWFRTPNDPYDNGWEHWGDIPRHLFASDMWPNAADYAPAALEKACEVKLTSGKQAYLFSAGWPETEDRHFAWMREYGIDGAFVQRFIGNPKAKFALSGAPEWVLGNVRAAANRNGRLWAIEYDVSGCPDDQLVDHIRRDWTWLVDHFGLRDDPAYAHENGKPVVFVWGMSLPGRRISLPTANAVLDFLQDDPKYGGNYVIGGTSDHWRDLSPDWKTHLARCDLVQCWRSTNYAEDTAGFRALGTQYYPMVSPGFSWLNLKHIPTASLTNYGYTSREGGKLYARQIADAVRAGADRLFVGMFDEYNEGTAIMPMSDDAPRTNHHPGTSVQFFKNDRWDGDPTANPLAQAEITLDGHPPAPGVPTTNFSLRFQGEIVVPTAGAYEFSVVGIPGDSARLTLGARHAEFDLPGGATTIRMAFAARDRVAYRLDILHRDGSGRVQLLWRGPGDPEPVLIPADAFDDAWGRFLTNEGQPPDLYLKMTGQWRRGG